MQGWIKLYRKILEDEDLKDPGLRLLFIELLLMAAHEDSVYMTKRYGPINLKRGQAITSTRKIASRYGWSRKRATKCLKNLHLCGKIAPQTGPHYSFITICKYDDYQAVLEKGSHEGSNEGSNGGSNEGNQDKEDKKKRSKEDNIYTKKKRPRGHINPSPENWRGFVSKCETAVVWLHSDEIADLSQELTPECLKFNILSLVNHCAGTPKYYKEKTNHAACIRSFHARSCGSDTEWCSESQRYKKLYLMGGQK